MSIYDDLADSGYLDKDDFRKHLQINSQLQPQTSDINRSRFMNDYDNSDKVNQDDNYSQFGVVGTQQIRQNEQLISSQFDRQHQLQAMSQLNFQGQDSRYQYSTNLQESKLVYSQMQDAGKLAKEDLYSKAHLIEEDDVFERADESQRLFEDDIIHVQQTNHLNQRQQETGRFPGQLKQHIPADRAIIVEDDRFNIDKYRENNEQLQQILSQLQPSKPVEKVSSRPSNQMNQGATQAYKKSGLTDSSTNNQQFSENHGSGPNQKNLNKDNSILEIAKMQNSNASNSDNYHNHSAIHIDYLQGHNNYFPSRDQSRIERSNIYTTGAHNYDFLSQHNPPSTLLNSGLTANYMPQNQMPISQFQQPVVQFKPELAIGQPPQLKQVSELPDKENVNYNNIMVYQSSHARTVNPQIKPQQPQYPQQQFQQPLVEQMKPQLSKTDFYKDKQLNEQDQKKKDLMERFDDIPIKELNKAEGYQHQMAEEGQFDEGADESSLTLIQRANHSKWKIRMRAYKDIGELFYGEYSKECLKADFDQNPLNEEEDSQDKPSPFDQYQSILEKIIADSNLAAQYEGLNCLYAFVRFAPEIKQVIFLVHVILLEKIHHNKPNLKEITLKILLTMLRRDKSQTLFSELIRRYRNKNLKIASFSIEVSIEAMKNSLLQEEPSLRQIFKSVCETASHTNKELRDLAIECIREVYRACADDSLTFIKNIKSLRPIQAKEIKELLDDSIKLPNVQTSIFGKEQQQQPEGLTPKKTKTKLDQDLQGVQLIPQKESQSQDFQSSQENQIEVDLNSLVPENFNEIPYISQIAVKKKTMEQFNSELEKLTQRKGGCTVQNKDYTGIFNVVTHMLEDSNALVFMEGIKTVENLCLLMGKNIKQQKLKGFISLLADKYKETKTAPVQAVNKSISTMIKKQSISTSTLVEHMICQIAATNKNPRVKQLIVEKVDQSLNEVALREDELSQIFKTIKDKILGFIQKDTNAGVRDASVNLLITFKYFLFDNGSINEAINSLPKYRITEIIKEAEDRMQKQNPNVKPSSSQKAVRPISAKDELKIAKNDLIGHLRILSTVPLAQMNAQSISQNWDEAIEALGEEGVQQQKPLIIATVHQLLLQIHLPIKDNISVLDALLILLKRIFCIQRTVERDPITGASRELDQAVEIALYSATLLEIKKQPEGLLNVLITACSHPSEFIASIQKSLPSFVYHDNHIEMLDFLFKWLAVKSDFMVKRGAQFSEFEELRNTALAFITDKTEQSVKAQITQILIQFKNSLFIKKQALLGGAGVAEKEEAPATTDQQPLVHVPVYVQPPAPVKTLGQTIVETLDQDFERGLHLIKSIASNPGSFDSESKDLVFNKLLQIVCVVCKTPQEQYQQAYSLKALLWMREELFGIEDSFRLTTKVMCAYAQAEVECRDNSVELYLLNHWVREFSIRDLIDRIQVSTQVDNRHFLILFKWLSQNKLTGNEAWVIEDFRKLAHTLAKHLKIQEVEDFLVQAIERQGKYKIRDFMEIQLMHYQADYNQFINWFTNRYEQDQQQQFADKLKIPQILNKAEPSAQKTKKYDDPELREALASPYLKQQPLESAPSTSRPHSNNQMDHSKLYKQLREQRKFTNQKRQEEDHPSDNKYDQIINKLEAELHKKYDDSNEKEPPATSQFNLTPLIQGGLRVKDEEPRPKTRSTSRGGQQETNNRYQGMLHSDDEEEEHKEGEVQPELQARLLTSNIQENHYKLQLEALQQEKRRLDQERELLMLEKNHETREWQKRYENMAHEHEEVTENLKEANKCYLKQVGENEDLKRQIEKMQIQQRQMMDKFNEFEQRLRGEERGKVIIEEEKVKVIKETFMLTEDGDNSGEMSVKKIQELLLNFTDASSSLSSKEIGDTLFMHFQSMRSIDQRLTLVRSLHHALDKSEDVLFALPLNSYKAILDFNLKAFGHEKALIEERSIRGSTAQGSKNNEQNEVTIEVQKIVSKLLNSKEFTTSLVTLFDLLRNAMPVDLYTDLNGMQKQHLKVIMRCVSRIQKALPSEHPDLIRAFDVLLEMQKLFQINPPESLREDLPCLEDFDAVYRGLKDVADRMMELQPDKVRVFLEFVATASDQKKNDNAFVKYMRQVMGVASRHQQEDEDDDEEY